MSRDQEVGGEIFLYTKPRNCYGSTMKILHFKQALHTDAIKSISSVADLADTLKASIHVEAVSIPVTKTSSTLVYV